MRINRFIARSGVTSRRKAEDLIISGKIKIDGITVTDLNTNINEKKSVVTVNDQIIELPKLKYFLFNKPTGYTTTKGDPFSRHNIFELLPKDSSLFPVGRLDRNTSGLILITNDGKFGQNIIHPTKKIEKEYLIRTKLEITTDQIEKLLRGVELEDGIAKAKKIQKISPKEILMTIEMGRKRVIRRMIDTLGNNVIGLTRIRIGNIKLDIPVGKYRELKQKEIKPYV